MHLQLLRDKPYKIAGSESKTLVTINSLSNMKYHDRYYQIRDEDTGILMIVPESVYVKAGSVTGVEKLLKK